MQRGDEERNFAERAGHLESLEKNKSDNNQDFRLILFWFCWKHTHTQTHTSHAHIHTHTR